ncbi:uncharacterized protein TRIADDRAFT_54417 [Trichoplax adhaerens]|uniref:G-protein coupled receptors family 1 profile domain-containing protein n=1 Tax=Trichoplax adhaerens TaxID=10228 RepID=B3RRZ2_TRIAD|nr:hypothetical protein TRIADDRAFT_54417 [Trichoplax adhaerens]EDV26433.1 hypothetical protein TRIADDRAFT_54417 [Trichoplax adhaerens]|eukprot:XP_002110429.1 hypothetical protein TRIADDRAFT_54417 [Trichoplax adhaerens]
MKYNISSSLDRNVIPLSVGIIQAILLIIIFIIGLVGNILVIVVIKRYEISSSPINILLLNFVSCDILSLFILYPITIIVKFGLPVYPFDSSFCSFEGFLRQTCSIVTILTLTVISVGRYDAIVPPVHKRDHVITQLRAKMFVVWTWIIAFIFSFPPIVGWNHYIYASEFSYCLPQCLHSDRNQSNQSTIQSSLLYGYLLYPLVYNLPLLVMIHNYCNIFRAIQTKTDRLQQRQGFIIRKQSKFLFELRTCRIMFTITAFIMVLMYPYILSRQACFISVGVNDTFASGDAYSIIMSFLGVLTMAAPAVTPAILPLMHRRFKREFYGILCSWTRSHKIQPLIYYVKAETDEHLIRSIDGYIKRNEQRDNKHRIPQDLQEKPANVQAWSGFSFSDVVTRDVRQHNIENHGS